MIKRISDEVRERRIESFTMNSASVSSFLPGVLIGEFLIVSSESRRERISIFSANVSRHRRLLSRSPVYTRQTLNESFRSSEYPRKLTHCTDFPVESRLCIEKVSRTFRGEGRNYKSIRLLPINIFNVEL